MNFNEMIDEYALKYGGSGTVELLRRFLSAPDSLERPYADGHLTGSAWLVNRSRDKVFLVHHRKLDRWFQPGGHVDEGETVSAAARRECIEESGINEVKQLDEGIYDIDIHLIPGRGEENAHYHYDIRFLFEADCSADYELSCESVDGGWIPLEKAADYNGSESIMRMVRKLSGTAELDRCCSEQ